VVFVEPPMDIRDLPNARPSRLFGADHRTPQSSHRGPKVVARSTAAPGHLNRLAEAIDTRLLRRVLAREAGRVPTVCNLPWQWPALVNQGRKVFDCADDWTKLFPASRRPRFLELFRQIAAEADEVIVASKDLAPYFGTRPVTVIPNGADSADLAAPPRPRPNQNSFAYVGTFSERFDTATVAAMMRALPDWELDLYGPARYAGRRGRPAHEFGTLLEGFGRRIRWHGTISRSEVHAAIDAADVVIVPLRSEMTVGQSSMKLFDVAARGRPAIVSSGVSTSDGELPPGTYVAESADEWIASITAAANEPDGLAQLRVDWARSNTWDDRWPTWRECVLGADSLWSDQ
ncbi:MAG TPA: glycosyltransferase, partial [Acidimicrobiales bacterium]|nr:glycosyltransferase [Acidimicrobiales bacterium]